MPFEVEAFTLTAIKHLSNKHGGNLKKTFPTKEDFTKGVFKSIQELEGLTEEEFHQYGDVEGTQKIAHDTYSGIIKNQQQKPKVQPISTRARLIRSRVRSRLKRKPKTSAVAKLATKVQKNPKSATSKTEITKQQAMWWDKLSRKTQITYVTKHPRSKFKDKIKSN